jgi:hypothetical protein
MPITTIRADVQDALWRDACRITYPGAVNPAAIASAIAKHTSALTPIIGTRAACDHPAVQCMVGQLAFLCGLSLGPSIEALDACKANAARLAMPWED